MTEIRLVYSENGSVDRDSAILWSADVNGDTEVSELVDELWSAMPGPLKTAIDGGQVGRFSLLTGVSAILQRKNGLQDLAPGLALHYRV